MSWRPRFKASRLSYTRRPELQYQAAVKVLGSFRPSAGNEHLYSYCNFAESPVETAPKSLRHSCRSELHVDPLLLGAQTIPSPLETRNDQVGRVLAYAAIHLLSKLGDQLEPFRSQVVTLLHQLADLPETIEVSAL